MSLSGQGKKLSIFEEHLRKDHANFEPLTPVSFLRRAAQVTPSRTAIIHGQRRYSYAQFLERSSRLANALAAQVNFAVEFHHNQLSCCRIAFTRP